jgi:hypothetical protein
VTHSRRLRAPLLLSAIVALAIALACSASAAGAPAFRVTFLGEGVAEPTTGRCVAIGSTLRCSFATSLARCARGGPTVALGQRDPIRERLLCKDRTTGRGGVLRVGRTWRARGFTCRVFAAGQGVARTSLLECRARSRHGFAVGTKADIERLSPAVDGPGARAITIDRGIGPVQLGQTPSEVEALLGPPSRRGTFTWDSNGRPGLAFSYRLALGMLSIEFGDERVVVIETDSSLYRTSTGAGPGRSLRLAASLAGFAPEACTEGYSNERLGLPVYTTFRGGGYLDWASGVRVESRGWSSC